MSGLIILMACVVGWAIGASNGSNIVSMIAGPNIASLKSAAVIVSLFLFAGAMAQGSEVIKTVGEKVVPKEDLAKNKLAVFCALLAAATCIILTLFEAVPISASHAVIGSLVGCSIALNLTEKLDYPNVVTLVLSWLVTPIIALVIAFLIYKLAAVPLSKKISLVAYSEMFRTLSIAATAFTAYAMGANNIGNASALVISSGAYEDYLVAVVLGAVSMVVGVFSHSDNMVRTISKNITILDPVTCFTAQLSAGLVTLIFTVYGIPISSIQAIIGGLTGVGMTKGYGMINGKLFTQIFIGWIITPVMAAVLTIGIYEILSAAV